jgi:hypothetical protein
VQARGGYRVLRLSAALIEQDIETAVALVPCRACAVSLTPHRSSAGAAEGCAALCPLRVTINPTPPGFGCRVFILSLVSSVGAGRFDGCHHRGRLLMRDPHENRGFRVGLPDGR